MQCASDRLAQEFELFLREQHLAVNFMRWKLSKRGRLWRKWRRWQQHSRSHVRWAAISREFLDDLPPLPVQLHRWHACLDSRGSASD
jgi:hypothetical protein